MILTFWGVRGSTPAPGPETVRYGGNTACVALDHDGRMLVIDAGTGIRPLGVALLRDPREVFLLLTHVHADHLIGFPFFAPLFESDVRVRLLDYRHEGKVYSIAEMFDGLHVPMRFTQMSRSCERVREDALPFLARHGFHVDSIALNHPGGALGYRIRYEGRSFVHITDNELGAHQAGSTTFDDFVEFCRGADVLSHDAQWIDEELPARLGWGHSTVNQACDLAVAAGVRRVVLFHHDPERSDRAVDELQAEARRRLAPHAIDCVAAWEGLRIDLGALAASEAGVLPRGGAPV